MGPKKKKGSGAVTKGPKPLTLKTTLPPTHIQKVGTQLELIVEAENEGKVSLKCSSIKYAW